MPKPSSDNDEPIDGDMFDFLSEDAANRAGREKNPAESGFDEDLPLKARKVPKLPIIRKPVPVSESGPNQSQADKAANAQARRVSQAPAQRHQQQSTNAGDDDFDFLSEESTPTRRAPARPEQQNDYEFNGDWREGVHDHHEYEGNPRKRKGLWLALGLVGVVGLGAFVADQSGLFQSNSPAQSEQDSSANDLAVAPSADTTAGLSIGELFRQDLTRIESFVAAGEFDAASAALDSLDPRVAGYGTPEFTALRTQIAAGDSGQAVASQTNQNLEAEAQRLANEAVIAEEKRVAAEALVAKQAEEVRLAAEGKQAEEAKLAAEAQLAEQARLAAEAQLAEDTRLAAEAQLAEDARLAAEAERAEDARLAAEAQRAEDARLAAEAQRAEDARLAAEARSAEETRLEAAQRAEAARIAAEAQRLEDARLATEAQRAEDVRLAAEAQRAEQSRLATEAQRAEKARLAEQANNTENNLQAEAERLERERLEVIAAEQRADARRAAAERAAQASGQAASQSLASAAVAPSAAPQASTDREATDREATDRLLASTPSSTPPPSASTESSDQLAVGSYPISDADFQSTYKRFIDVKSAIERRDINLITQLAVTDGARVQGLLQLFSNSEEVRVSIDNVSTRNSSAMIIGTLTIREVVRRGGSTIKPPANLRSFTLTTRRDAAGWSKIQW